LWFKFDEESGKGGELIIIFFGFFFILDMFEVLYLCMNMIDKDEEQEEGRG